MMRPAISGDDILKKAHAVGQYYGFTPYSTLAFEARGKKREKRAKLPDTFGGLALDQNAKTMAAFLKQCRVVCEEPNPRQPLFVWHTNVASGRQAPKRAVVQFHALGSDHAIADAVVIRTLATLVRDLYHEEPVIRINSMGDKETRARYARELSSFFKKRAANFSEECLSCAKRDALEAAELAIAESCAEDLPAPTDHLSDAARRRFEDLLEYLEATETPYELARDLISRGNTWSETCFEITVGGERIAWGSRYGELARHFFPGAPSAIGGVLYAASSGQVAAVSTPRSRFSFVHIGDEAKRISIKLTDDFKKTRLPLTQHLGVESLTEQLALVERRNPTYVLIMGRKEALEGSVILRNRDTHEEHMLPLLNLAERLKTVV